MYRVGGGGGALAGDRGGGGAIPGDSIFADVDIVDLHALHPRLEY